MKENELNISKYMSLILRHKPQTIGISLDKNGWVKVDELIIGINKTYPLNMNLLEKIVKEDKKQRYSFNQEKTLIRANQGHSVLVDVELEKTIPPNTLWHGTGEKYANSIIENGLIPKSRLYVHLSSSYDTAVNVGSRHGKPIVFIIDAKKMFQDGYEFYISKNGVWLTKNVSNIYIHSM